MGKTLGKVRKLPVTTKLEQQKNDKADNSKSEDVLNVVTEPKVWKELLKIKRKWYRVIMLIGDGSRAELLLLNSRILERGAKDGVPVWKRKRTGMSYVFDTEYLIRMAGREYIVYHENFGLPLAFDTILQQQIDIKYVTNDNNVTTVQKKLKYVKPICKSNLLETTFRMKVASDMIMDKMAPYAKLSLLILLAVLAIVIFK